MCKDASRPPPLINSTALSVQIHVRLDRTIIIIVVVVKTIVFDIAINANIMVNEMRNLICVIYSKKFYVHFHDQTVSRSVVVRLERKRFVPRSVAQPYSSSPCAHAYVFFFFYWNESNATGSAVFDYAYTCARHRVWKYIMSLPERERTRTRCVRAINVVIHYGYI